MCPVWSSELGGDLRKATEQESTDAGPQGPVHLRRSTQGRGGKAVIVISNLQGGKEQLKALASLLKKKTGSGGSLKPDATIEIQGDILLKVKETLLSLGYSVKQIGG